MGQHTRQKAVCVCITQLPVTLSFAKMFLCKRCVPWKNGAFVAWLRVVTIPCKSLFHSYTWTRYAIRKAGLSKLRLTTLLLSPTLSQSWNECLMVNKYTSRHWSGSLRVGKGVVICQVISVKQYWCEILKNESFPSNEIHLFVKTSYRYWFGADFGRYRNVAELSSIEREECQWATVRVPSITWCITMVMSWRGKPALYVHLQLSSSWLVDKGYVRHTQLFKTQL